ncbi:hypothetical protein P4T20_13200 [Aneurinibacillus thermoaerophilus]|uniref:hypothetical protein n=1 Tax=Aneurinibacillus thermoaerophilus TaxID=143495 RepID=UPI002E215B9E|nr:hypothetical protein [Aneurinibacillus thermoaerophilus]
MFEFLARIKSITWLHRKCGCNIYASSKIGMGRQRSTLPGTGKATMGAEEMEYEES